MNYIIGLHHIVFTLAAIVGAVGWGVRLYVKNVSNKIKEEINVTITDARKSINHDVTDKLTDKLTIMWKEDISKTKLSIETGMKQELTEIKNLIERECSTTAIKNKVKDDIRHSNELHQKDMDSLKEGQSKLEELIKTQQETLLAIQASLSNEKPRIDNHENRITKIENES